MKVILMEDVASLGKAGDVVAVSAGYARNYLIPKNIALEANSANVKKLELQKGSVVARSAKEKSRAEAEAESIEAVSVTIARKVGDQEKLFGSVTAKDIVEALAARDVRIDKKNILLEEPLKELGEFKVKVKFQHGVFADLTVQVVAEG